MSHALHLDHHMVRALKQVGVPSLAASELAAPPMHSLHFFPHPFPCEMGMEMASEPIFAFLEREI